MNEFLYYSTNRNSPDVNLETALFTGQAPDKGLYMPKEIPRFSSRDLRYMSSMTYSELAEFVLGKFVHDTFEPDTLMNLCVDAYNYPVPLEYIHERKYIMRLDRGPTASFKDFAARMMARLFGSLMRGKSGELVILTATSGDTGSAIAHAFYEIPNIRVVVLFPPKEVSNRQRKQMTTLGKNIQTIGINGKFDDCQALVKRAFADSDLSEINLTSANSINIGRILPQIVYYVYAYSQLAKGGEDIYFSVPSGNFGNMMGCLLAMEMGIPVKKLIISTNANDEVPVYLSTGDYSKIVPSRECISNAMNVGHPSNFARVIELFGGSMDETGLIHQEPDIKGMRDKLWTTSITDDETKETIKSAWENHKLLLEPHGSVGWAGLNRFIEENQSEGLSDKLMISLETAHPAKFPEQIEDLLSISPKVPDSLAGIEEKDESFTELENDYDQFKNFLKDNFI